MRVYTTILLGMALSCGLCHAQETYNESMNEGDDFESFRQFIHKDFESFRQTINKKYAEFIRHPWKETKNEEPTPKPKDDMIPPVVKPENDNDKPVDPKPVPIEEVIKPVIDDAPQPEPIEPIKEQPLPVENYVEFVFFGTKEKVRIPIQNTSNAFNKDVHTIEDVASIWETLSNGEYDNLLLDCLNTRRTRRLCDWAYLQMIRELCEQYFGGQCNMSTLMTAWIYCQSGYQMRLAIEGARLHLLIGSKHQIFGQSYYRVDETNFYPFLHKDEEIKGSVQICGASFPNESALSLLISQSQEFADNYKGQRTIKSARYPNVTATIKVNQNLMSFYNTYPSSMLDENIMTRWAMYANTPLASDVITQLYQQLRPLLSGKSQLDAVNILLNWVQTGFEYEYDDKVWGGDRAFFAEESLNYPYCDCEDRSILFTRLVRDLLGLKCILVFYPGHLAAAVSFSDFVSGDYIQLNGQKYIVSDPTYIGASVGMTMPKMDNQTAKIILLE